ncbi:MAG: integrase arm-type DNA-binding domain-containing protein [Pseudomonadota bacterium]|nr:integrase arm-type DNA-binding domain-containing protein [Pseudomonadota bacterium]
MKLTELACRNAKPKEKPYKLSDGGGLYMEVFPTGAKYWRMKYRFLGKEKRLAFGVYPEVSIAEARGKREVARKVLSEGRDPSFIKKETILQQKIAHADSFESVAREWFEKQKNTWSEKYAENMLGRMENNLFPCLGKSPIALIEPPELLNVLRIMEQRGVHDMAHRCLGIARSVFRYAIASGRCRRNPATDLEGALTPHKKKNYAAVEQSEIPALIKAISAYDERGMKITQIGLQLLALTFLRTSELIKTKWIEIDFENALLCVPAERMKMAQRRGTKEDHLVPLARQTIRLLQELKQISGDSPYILPGRNFWEHMSNNTMLQALYRLGYKGLMTGHGFRTLASTFLNETNRFQGDAIECQLSHHQDSVRAIYNKAKYLPERRDIMQFWADHLESVVQEKKVIPFRVA